MHTVCTQPASPRPPRHTHTQPENQSPGTDSILNGNLLCIKCVDDANAFVPLAPTHPSLHLPPSPPDSLPDLTHLLQRRVFKGLHHVLPSRVCVCVCVFVFVFVSVCVCVYCSRAQVRVLLQAQHARMWAGSLHKNTHPPSTSARMRQPGGVCVSLSPAFPSVSLPPSTSAVMRQPACGHRRPRAVQRRRWQRGMGVKGVWARKKDGRGIAPSTGTRPRWCVCAARSHVSITSGSRV